jgi:VacB/RNase II family 3'-5' exoribonuclease
VIKKLSSPFIFPHILNPSQFNPPLGLKPSSQTHFERNNLNKISVFYGLPCALNCHKPSHAEILEKIAKTAMLESGLSAEISQKANAEASNIKAPVFDANAKDLRSLNWISIDNDDSKDLDQISTAQKLANGDIKVWVAIADVDALVPKGSALDQQAAQNTATIYTPSKNFSMIPEKLSNGFTSLNPGEDRLAIVTEMTIAPDGTIRSSNIYKAMVNNHAKLAYKSVSAWLDNKASISDYPLLEPLKNPAIAEQVKLQDEAARRLKAKRESAGFLDFDLQKPEIHLENGEIKHLNPEERNRAHEIIENLMVTYNGIAARFLKSRGFPVIQRIVPPPSPEAWREIMAYAGHWREMLPNWPDSRALEAFLEKRKIEDPLRYPDVALKVLKWMGHASYIVEKPGQTPIGHFGLAAKDYTHSTAPNRRYPDLVTQRLLKSALDGKPCPYTIDELAQIAQHCTAMERAIKQVERQIAKSASALYLQGKIGQTFRAVVSQVNPHGTFVRLLDLPVEGKILATGLPEGKFLKVKLVGVDVEKGHLNFSLSHRQSQQAA